MVRLLAGTRTSSQPSPPVLTDLLYLFARLRFEFEIPSFPGLLASFLPGLPTLREKLRTSYFLAMKVFLLLALLFVAIAVAAAVTSTTTTADDDSQTRLIEAAAVFVVKHRAGCINQVLQDVGISAEESKDRKLQLQVNARIAMLKHTS